ncbi:MAG: CPBP family intramembrane glutamic endopeptidase [Wenzhouxiangella sp.]
MIKSVSDIGLPFQTFKAGRAVRAFAQAGLEFALAFCFLIFSLFLLIAADRFGAGLPLLVLEGRVVMDFWEYEDDRANRAEATLERLLPHRSTYTLEETQESLGPDFDQRLVLNVTYRNLTAFYDWMDLPWTLFDELGGNRGAFKSDFNGVHVPYPILAVVATHLLIIPWLIIRLWFMPKVAIPAKPLIRPIAQKKNILASCVGAGLLLGMLIPVSFISLESLNLLQFSEAMPSLESLGISLDHLWIGALLLGLCGAAEEVFFRGILLRRFVQNGLPVLGIVVCAFWFTVAHAPFFSFNSGNIAYMLVIASAGLGLGFLTLRTRTWVPAAIVHANYNFTVTLVAGWSLM